MPDSSDENPRSSAWVGIVILIAGIGMMFEAGYSYLKGEAIHMVGAQTLQWWEALPIGALGIFFGALLAGWMTPSGSDKPNRW